MQDLKGRLAGSRRAKGQGLVEFALVIPILFLIAVAVGDFGRVYVSLIAGESAAREAADYAAFNPQGQNFVPQPACVTFLDPACVTPVPNPLTVAEMRRRACAAVGDLANCSDPSFFSFVIEDHRGDPPWKTACVAPQPDPATCGWVVHVTITFDFHTVIDLPPIPNTVTITRDSLFAISALPSP